MKAPRFEKGMRLLTAACVVGVGLAVTAVAPRGQSAGRADRMVSVTARTPSAVSDWDRAVDRMTADGHLRQRSVRPDLVLPGRTHERLDQYYRGVRVFGAQVARQTAAGATVSIFGGVYDNIDVPTVARLSDDQARTRVKAITGAAPIGNDHPELVVLPMADGSFKLAYYARVLTRTDLLALFIDANTGAELHRYSNLQTQAAVGTGRGVHNDQKKLSVNQIGGTYFAEDQHRPPNLITLDMRTSIERTIAMLDGLVPVQRGDVASDTDNAWTDAAIVDAHTYIGWTYDYYFKRFNRRGLDNNDAPIYSLNHTVRRGNPLEYDDEIVGTYFLNAFWCGGCGPQRTGMIVFGEGLAPGWVTGNYYVDYFSASIDIVAHELTHGVTEFSSGLIYEFESGALNEAFSDIIGTSVEFFFQPRGAGPLRADYLIAEDNVIPESGGVPPGFRSMAAPNAYGDPDHYSIRFRGEDDNGGVHINSGIVNHAFYLAVEGGTNRVSGRTVQGVGAANREQIEKVFYRAFTSMLTPRANFAIARQATLQAAIDLYGAGSPAFRAMSEAWDAVGVL